MLLYFIRHGDPIYNPDSLTPLGLRQAEAVGKRLALHGIDEIYSSPSNREVQTATPLSEMLKKPITKLGWCNESLVWNEFTVTNEDGQKNWMFRESKVIKKFTEKLVLEPRNDWYNDPFFDKKVGEGVKRVNTELDDFLKDFGYIHDREKGIYKVEKNNEKVSPFLRMKGLVRFFLAAFLIFPIHYFLLDSIFLIRA